MRATIGRTCVVVASVWLVAVGQAWGEDAPAPTAHHPCFDQKDLWPEDVKKTAYYSQKWEPARLLVWARQADFRGAAGEPGNWTEYLPDGSGGRPAEKGPDGSTDVLFPDATGKSCRIGFDGGLSARHITVGQGVKVSGRSISATGNVWVRSGALLGCNARGFSGSAHTFARNETSSDMGGHHIQVDKHGDGSVEVFGPWGSRDSFRMNSGTLILGHNAVFNMGDRHPNVVAPGGTIVLTSGARLQCWGNKPDGYDLEVFGVLQAGTAERPLTKDAVVGLSAKTRGKVGDFARARASDRGLVVHGDGRVAVHSADPEKARLVFRWNGQTRASQGNLPDEVPRQIDMALLGKTELNGVEFNDVRIAGIELPGPEVRRQWKNVFYGKGNAGEPDRLYRLEEASDAP